VASTAPLFPAPVFLDRYTKIENCTHKESVTRQPLPRLDAANVAEFALYLLRS